MSGKDKIKTDSESIDMSIIFEIIKEQAEKKQPIVEFKTYELLELFNTEIGDLDELIHNIFTMQYNMSNNGMRSSINIFLRVVVDAEKIMFLLDESVLKHIEQNKINFADIEVKIVRRTKFN
jgi:hypothetical protein